MLDACLLLDRWLVYSSRTSIVVIWAWTRLSSLKLIWNWHHHSNWLLLLHDWHDRCITQHPLLLLFLHPPSLLLKLQFGSKIHISYRIVSPIFSTHYSPICPAAEAYQQGGCDDAEKQQNPCLPVPAFVTVVGIARVGTVIRLALEGCHNARGV